MYIVDNPGCNLATVAGFARDFYLEKEQGVYIVNVDRNADFLCFDYYYDGTEGLWFQYCCGRKTEVDIFSREYRELTRSMSAVSRCENSRDVNLDCVVLARAKASQAIEASLGNETVGVGGYIPSISGSVLEQRSVQHSHPSVDRIGFYPIVPDAHWFELVALCGVKTIQLRVKDRALHQVEAIVKRCAEIASKHAVALIVNDYWELAKKYGAYGVHLGQDDIKTADMNNISGMCLGISTHCYHELARARFYRPSYVALGPIYGTTSKKMPYRAQGIELLKEWVEYNKCVVAIGGITLDNIGEVLECGVSGIAVISAVTESENPQVDIARFLAACTVPGNNG